MAKLTDPEIWNAKVIYSYATGKCEWHRGYLYFYREDGNYVDGGVVYVSREVVELDWEVVETKPAPEVTPLQKRLQGMYAGWVLRGGQPSCCTVNSEDIEVWMAVVRYLGATSLSMAVAFTIEAAGVLNQNLIRQAQDEALEQAKTSCK